MQATDGTSYTSQSEIWSRYTTLFAGVNDPVLLVYGPDLEILECNDAAETMLGASNPVLAGQRLPDLADPSCPLSAATLLRATRPIEVVLKKGLHGSCFAEAQILFIPDSVETHFIRLRDLSDEQEIRMKRRQLLYSLVQMAGTLDPDYVLRFLTQTMVMQFNAVSALSFTSGDGERRKATAFNGDSKEEPPVKEEALRALARDGVSLYTQEFPREDWCADRELAEKHNWQCYYATPLQQGENKLGAVTMVTETPLSEEDVESLEALASQAAMSLHNAEVVMHGAARQRRVAEELEALERRLRWMSEACEDADKVAPILNDIERRLVAIRNVVNEGT